MILHDVVMIDRVPFGMPVLDQSNEYDEDTVVHSPEEMWFLHKDILQSKNVSIFFCWVSSVFILDMGLFDYI